MRKTEATVLASGGSMGPALANLVKQSEPTPFPPFRGREGLSMPMLALFSKKPAAWIGGDTITMQCDHLNLLQKSQARHA